MPATLFLFVRGKSREIREEIEISERTRLLEQAFELGHWPANGRAK